MLVPTELIPQINYIKPPETNSYCLFDSETTKRYFVGAPGLIRTGNTGLQGRSFTIELREHIQFGTG